MDETISLRPAALDELPVVAALAERIWRACYPDILSDGQITYMLAWMYAPAQLRRDVEAGVVYELLRRGERPLGFCGYQVSGAEVKLHKLYLDPEEHGLGLGSRMLRHVEEAAQRSGCTRVVLGVNKHNSRAIRAYERNGFAIREGVVNDIGGGYVMDDWIMEKRLGAPVIFHLTTARVLRERLGATYAPPGWEREGFIHCAPDPETTLAVARSYFAQATEPVVVLRIETQRLQSECRFEAPAPLPGGSAHRTPGKLFPHVYGPIAREAITGVAELRRVGDAFVWPERFELVEG